MCIGMESGYRENKKSGEKLSLLKPYTNADMLREMSNDELVTMISDNGFFDCKFCAYHYKDTCNAECRKGFKEWLESEAEEQ